MKPFSFAPFPYQDYRVESIGFNYLSDAKQEIENYYSDQTCVAFFDEDDCRWYVIVKRK